jgi:hypothetical protein
MKVHVETLKKVQDKIMRRIKEEENTVDEAADENDQTI